MLTVGIIGNGFVGGACQQLECAANAILVYDIDPQKCRPLTTTLADVAGCNLIFICVPTPSRVDGTCHVDIVVSIVMALKKVNATANIIIRSTVRPGTCQSLDVSFMPEFLTEANSIVDFCNTLVWILGANKTQSLAPLVQQLLSNAKNAGKIVSDTLSIVSPTEAEMIKYGRNCFLCVKVGFFNEVYDACQKHQQCNYDTVRQGITQDPRIASSHTLVPGPDGLRGFGGTCLPKDIAAWCTFNPSKYSLVNAARRRNVELDRSEKDWEKDKGRTVL